MVSDDGIHGWVALIFFRFASMAFVVLYNLQ